MHTDSDTSQAQPRPEGQRTWGRLGRLLLRLHRDERGAEMVEKLLIVAAISLPLLGVLYFFVNNWLIPWLQEEADEMRGREMDSPFE